MIGFSAEEVALLRQATDQSWLIETSARLTLPDAYLFDLILVESSLYHSNGPPKAGQIPVVDLPRSQLSSEGQLDLWKVYRLAIGRISPFVDSDAGGIEVLLTHRPQRELSFVTEENFEKNLFHCAPDNLSLQEEYDVFLRSIRIESEGPIVLDIGNCVFDIVYKTDPATVSCFLEILGCDKCVLLASNATNTYSEVAGFVDELLGGVFWGGTPLTNLMYTRDPLFVCGGTVFLGKMRWPIRRKEPQLIRAVFQCHPFFSSLSETLVDSREDLNTPREMFLEGGDVISLGDGVFILGSGERTNVFGQRLLSGELLHRGLASTVVCVVGAESREFFHLDTVISVVSKGLVLCIKDQLNRCLDVVVRRLGRFGAVIEDSVSSMTIAEMLRSLGVEVLLVEDDVVQLSSDAVNLVCCRSNVLVGFQHNLKLYDSLSKQGLRVVPVHVDALWAGRGGPRCLTMPLVRTPG